MRLLAELFLEAVDLGAEPGRVVSGGRARLFEFSLEPVGTLAVFRRLGGGDVEERLELRGGSGGGVGVLLELSFECGRGLGGLFGLMTELFFEAVELGVGVGRSGVGAVGVVLRFLELCLELGDPVGRTLCLLGRRGTCLLQLVLKLPGAVAVFGGFGG